MVIIIRYEGRNGDARAGPASHGALNDPADFASALPVPAPPMHPLAQSLRRDPAEPASLGRVKGEGLRAAEEDGGG